MHNVVTLDMNGLTLRYEKYIIYFYRTLDFLIIENVVHTMCLFVFKRFTVWILGCLR